MKTLRKVTRNEINKENMVALSYCQCQQILNLFAYDNKIGYNAGMYGWNYNLYEINGCSIVTGYNVPYAQYSDKEKKRKLIRLEKSLRSMSFSDIELQKKELKEKFLEIFE